MKLSDFSKKNGSNFSPCQTFQATQTWLESSCTQWTDRRVENIVNLYMNKTVYWTPNFTEID